MMRPFRPTLAAAAFAAGIALSAAPIQPALAASPATAASSALSAQDQAVVAEVETYLNGIHTLKSRFLQVAPNGRQTTGTFYLSRPGKMRLEYDPPVKDFIVADGTFIFYWDGEMRQQSSAPIGSSLADFILRPNIRLSGDVRVTNVFRAPGVVEVSLVQTDDPGKGTLTLVFEDHPFQLRKWRVVDAQGLTTEVALLNPESGMPLDRDLFYFVEPKKGADFGHGN